MNLLPKAHEEFSKSNYWDAFFKKRGKKSFEWYGEFPELSSYLLKYVKIKDKVLIVGCGNSTLGSDLYDSGYKNITNIDVSKVVINQMNEKNKKHRPDLIFEVQDATKMGYSNDNFSVIFDKGTLDALMPDENPETISRIDNYFAEIQRVLSNNGRYICISLLQEHILKKLIPSFQNQFALRIIRCNDVEVKARNQGESTMPVFMFVATKFVKLPMPILEVAFTEGTNVRLKGSDEMINSVISVQESALLCSNLHRSSLPPKGELSLDLYKPGDDNPRYTIFIVEKVTTKKNKTYSAFIVPQGREVDWIFCTKEGRQELLESTQYHRLAIVILNRGFNFKDLDIVKDELADSIKNLAPAECINTKIPFLSLGSSIGFRKILCEGESKYSGKYIVEEVEKDNAIFRRLIFLNNPFVIQSEAKIMKESVKTRLRVDPWFLACEHHIHMCLGVYNHFKNMKIRKILIIGLGGGGLCMFLRHILPQLDITVIEIDEAVLNVATTHFDLVQNKNLKVEIADGLDFIKNCAAKSMTYDAILFDVDNKDTSIGMSCPPEEFTTDSFLATVCNLLKAEGIFILNVVARNITLKNKVIDTLKTIYKCMVTCNIQDEVNEIIYCFKCQKTFEMWKNSLKTSANSMKIHIESKRLTADQEIFDISSLLNNFTFVS